MSALDNNSKKILYLLKTMNESHLDATMEKGRFCFCRSSVFNKWENKDSAQYDPWDSHTAFEASYICVAPIIDEKGGQLVYGKGQKISDKGIIHLQTEEAKVMPVCCFRIVEEDEISQADNLFYYSLGETADRISREFGHDSYVLIERVPFLERLAKKCRYYHGPVVYQDILNYFEFNVPENIKEIAEQIYRKDERFAWQKEFRIALPPNENEKVFIELGSIEDIAISGKLSDLKT